MKKMFTVKVRLSEEEFPLFTGALMDAIDSAQLRIEDRFDVKNQRKIIHVCTKSIDAAYRVRRKFQAPSPTFATKDHTVASSAEKRVHIAYL